jgi:heme oxygenase (mycobilin-producing)
MIKVLLERTIKGKKVHEMVRLLRKLRVKAMQQPGYISGETLHALENPNDYLVISTWEGLAQWENWAKSPERLQLQAELAEYEESPPKARVYTY